MARILIIDDDDLVRMTLTQTLERDGHVVTEASEGEEGVAAFRHSQADVVVTDILMPNQEGIRTIIELRKINPEVKIIAISGGSRGQIPSFLGIARRLGANATLEKPFDTQALRDTVRACLEPMGEAGKAT